MLSALAILLSFERRMWRRFNTRGVVYVVALIGKWHSSWLTNDLGISLLACNMRFLAETAILQKRHLNRLCWNLAPWGACFAESRAKDVVLWIGRGWQRNSLFHTLVTEIRTWTLITWAKYLFFHMLWWLYYAFAFVHSESIVFYFLISTRIFFHQPFFIHASDLTFALWWLGCWFVQDISGWYTIQAKGVITGYSFSITWSQQCPQDPTAVVCTPKSPCRILW